MALQNITPQYQAEEKTAQFHLRPVPIHNGLYETGKMLTDAGQGLQKGAFSLTLGLKQRNDRLQAEEDELALASKLNYVTSEATKFVAELNKRTGYEADGNTKEYETHMDSLLAKGQEGLSVRAARIFANRFANLRLSLWNSVNGHEFSNTRSAKIAEKKNLVKNGLATFQLTEDPNDLITTMQYQAELYEAQYGGSIPEELLGDWGRRRNPDTGAFDGEQKNNGWVGIHMNREGQVVTELSEEYEYDGKKYEVPMLNPYTADNFARIIDGDITEEDRELTRKWGEDRIAQGKSPFYNGDPDDEPLRRLDPSQRALESRLRLFKMEQQNVVDSAAGVLADKYAKSGDINSLSNLYDAIDQYGLPVGGDSFLPVSSDAKLQIKQVLDQQFDYQETFYGARTIFDEIKAYDPRSMAGDYFTDKQDQYAWERINELEASSDKKDQKMAQYIRSWYNDLVKTQQRNLGIAVIENTTGLFESNDPIAFGYDLMKLEDTISKMPDNPVREQLQILYDKKKAAWDAHNDSVVEDARKTMAKYYAAKDEAEAKAAAARLKELDDEKKRNDAQKAANEKAWQNSDYRNRVVSGFKLAFYTNEGVVSFGDGMSLDLKTKEGQKAFLDFTRWNGTNGWVFPEDEKYFNDMFSGRITSDAREVAAGLIADVLNVSRSDKAWNYINVNDMMPSLVDDVMRMLHTGDNPTDAKPLGGEKEKDIVKQYVSARLLEKATVKDRPSFWWNMLNVAYPFPVGTAYWMFGRTSSPTTLGDFMQHALDKYGELYPEEQTNFNMQREFDKLERSDEQDKANKQMRAKLELGGTSRVETPINYMLWAEKQGAAQNKVVEGAEE